MDDYEKSFITPDYSNQMLYKMSDMWRNDKFCDAILQAGKTEMKLHKLVLLCASPFLASHSNDITERMLTITLDIEVGASALKDFVSYLYFGALHLTSENIQPLEAMAKLLKVEAVMDFCSQFRQMFGMPTCDDSYTVNYVEEMLPVPSETHSSKNSFGIKLGRTVGLETPTKQVGKVYEDENEPTDDLHVDEDVDVNSCVLEAIEDKIITTMALEPIEVSATNLKNSLTNEQESLENEKMLSTEKPVEGGDASSIDKSAEGGGISSTGKSKGGGTCNICGKIYDTRTTLRRHERMHTSEMQCDICHAAFQQKSRLREHMEKHKTDQPYECNICKKKFRSREWMMKHIRFYHEGKNLYHCKLCDKRFIQKSKFDNHYASKHYKITLYVCRKCKKNFSNGPALSKHQIQCLGYVRVDSDSTSEGDGLEMYVCKTCSMSFITKKDMDKHCSSVHTKFHECSMCNIKLKTATALAKHQKELHSSFSKKD